MLYAMRSSRRREEEAARRRHRKHEAWLLTLSSDERAAYEIEEAARRVTRDAESKVIVSRMFLAALVLGACSVACGIHACYETDTGRPPRNGHVAP